MLHDDRGPVIESLVARTLRQVESTQNMIRIVGLSATLPNYVDVAEFLRVNSMTGLFFFDSGFRPVPLEQNFIGIKTENRFEQIKQTDMACYDEVLLNVRQGHQVIVFVHARNATGRIANALKDMARDKNESGLFSCDAEPGYKLTARELERSRNKQLKEIFTHGFAIHHAIHHAGMLRSDRNLVQKKAFADGHVRVLLHRDLSVGRQFTSSHSRYSRYRAIRCATGGVCRSGNFGLLADFRAGRPASI